MMEEFTSVTEEETVDIQGAELVEARILRYLKKAPFKCGTVAWNKASEGAKVKAVRCLNSKHRKAISKVILGETELTQDERDFLSKG
jgi:hypothetical protein